MRAKSRSNSSSRSTHRASLRTPGGPPRNSLRRASPRSSWTSMVMVGSWRSENLPRHGHKTSNRSEAIDVLRGPLRQPHPDTTLPRGAGRLRARLPGVYGVSAAKQLPRDRREEDREHPDSGRRLPGEMVREWQWQWQRTSRRSRSAERGPRGRRRILQRPVPQQRPVRCQRRLQGVRLWGGRHPQAEVPEPLLQTEEGPVKLLGLDPSKASLGTSLFLPKEVVREEPIQGALTFCFGRSAEPRTLARSHPAPVEVPRAFLGREQLAGLGVEVVDMRPKSFAPSSLRPKASFSLLPAQVETWRAFLLADGGGLHLACGGGKTILGLLKAAIMEGPLLVVSAQKAHLRNWEQELHDWFDLDGPVGWGHGKKMEYRREVVFATIQTLAKRVLAGSLPGDFHLWFSTVIYDEAHHMAAEHFSLAADVCAGERYGLTATPVRVDHNEGIVYSHLGRIFHSDVSQELRPEFHLVRTGVKLPDAEKHRVTDRGGEGGPGLLRIWLGEQSQRTQRI